MNKGRAKASTKHGSTIERVGFGQNRFVWLDLGVAFSHVDGILKDIEMREAVAQTNRIIESTQFRDAMSSAKSPEFHEVYQEWLKAIVGSYEIPLNWQDKVTLYLRTGVAMAEMGFSPRTMLQQPFGITQTIGLIGEEHTMKGVAKFLTNQNSAIQEAMELSAYLRNRGSTFNRDVRDAHRMLGVKGLHEEVVTWAFWGIQQLDMAVSIPSWLGAYEKAKDDGLVGQEAVDFADGIVARGQGGGLPRNISTLQNKRGIYRAFTMFYSFFSAYYNVQTSLYKQTDFKNPAQALKFAKNQVWITLIPALVIDYFFKGGPEDDDEWAKWAFKSLGSYMSGSMVWARDIGGAAFSGFSYQMSPAANAFKSVGNFIKQSGQGEMDQAWVKTGIMMASYLFHAPGGRPIVRAYDYLKDAGTRQLDEFEGWWRLLVQGKER